MLKYSSKQTVSKLSCFGGSEQCKSLNFQACMSSVLSFTCESDKI